MLIAIESGKGLGVNSVDWKDWMSGACLGILAIYTLNSPTQLRKVVFCIKCVTLGGMHMGKQEAGKRHTPSQPDQLDPA